MEITIRELNQNEIEQAIELVWGVFLVYESPDYSREGVKEFHRFIHDEKSMSMLRFLGAYDGEELIGVAATRTKGSHISLLFVDGRYHRQGIGRKLFWRILDDTQGFAVTVNSSPYAVPFYQRLGFEIMEEERTVDGIRFTSMKFVKG